MMKIISVFKSRIFYVINNFLKPLFYIHHYSSKKFNFDWEVSNAKNERINVLNKISREISAKKYLEIGCDTNVVFNNVNCYHKVGVDPLKGGTIRDTSDNFFKNNQEKFDLIFIDGLHTFDQILKDFHNSFKFLNNGGYIVMHDLIPRNWLEEHIPRISNDWCGDVWKISFLLNNIKHHDYSLILTDFGLGVFRKNHDDLSINKIDIQNKNFDFFYENLSKLNLIKKENFFNN